MINRIVQSLVVLLGAVLFSTLVYVKIDIIRIGGPVMVPIVMCSVFSLTLIVERLSYLFFQLPHGGAIERFFGRLRSTIEGQQWKEARALAEGLAGPVGRVVAAGLTVREATPQEIDEAMTEAAHEELPAVERHLRWLATLAQVSTLLGLLGTVTGLVRAFQVIQAKASTGNPVNPGDLAGGVWEALITTVAGLIVAIPTILAYNYFASRVGEVQLQMEKAAALLSNWRRVKPAESASVAGAGGERRDAAR